MSRARVLADRANQNTLAVDTTNSEVGIASTVPNATLDVRGEVKVGTAVQLGVAGVVTATSFSGSGSNLTGLATTETVRADTLTVAGVSTLTGAVNVDATTDSTSTTTGALIVDGGAAIAKNVYIGAGLSVAGTLTYEDVTNVDSVGLITAKSGVNVSGGQLAVGVAYSVGAAGVATAAGFVGPLTGDVTGDLTGAVSGTTGSFSSNLTVGSGITMGSAGVATFSGTSDVHLHDGVKALFGTGKDFEIYHNGSHGFLDSNTGDLRLLGDDLKLMRSDGSTYYVDCNAGTSVDLYYNNSLRLATTYGGVKVTGIGSFTGSILCDATGTSEANSDASDIVIGTTSDTNKGISIVGSTSGGIGQIVFTDGVGYKNQGFVQYRHADDEMRLRAGGTDIVRLTSTKVGVGTTNPQKTLHVEAASGESYVQIDTNSNGGILLDVQGTQRGVFATDSAFSGNLINLAVGAKNDFYLRTGSSYTERLVVTEEGGFHLSNGELVERCNITAGKLSDNTNIDLEDGMVHYFTTQESTTSTPNIRVSSSTSLNSVMDAGDVVTVTLVTTAAAGGYSANVTIDGNAVTEEWVGGSAPSAGGSDGLDVYSYTIICTHATNTGDSGFKVIANNINATN